jgi:hypothetical protein
MARSRKSPASQVARGFYQASHKLLVVVELLMGDIPDRGVDNVEEPIQISNTDCLRKQQIRVHGPFQGRLAGLGLPVSRLLARLLVGSTRPPTSCWSLSSC